MNIKYIDTSRIKQELSNNKIVIIAGFQGINSKGDISTLGRGGSDTTAVAIASALKLKKCYIYSDVDGVYTADPKKIKNSKKQSSLNKENRKKNVENAYVIKDGSQVKNKKILLFDDIYTTGNTVNECSRILRMANPEKIGVLVLAKD